MAVGVTRPADFSKFPSVFWRVRAAVYLGFGLYGFAASPVAAASLELHAPRRVHAPHPEIRCYR